MRAMVAWLGRWSRKTGIDVALKVPNGADFGLTGFGGEPKVAAVH